MQKKTAILIDGAWFSIAIRDITGIYPTAAVTHKHALALRGNDEELYRIFYYESMPHEKRETNPINKVVTDYSQSAPCNARLRFFRELGQMDFIALRRGVVKPRGWRLTKAYLNSVISGAAVVPTATDIELSFEQKGVDMRIGIDVATLTMKRIVDRIILVSGDTDMIPAMKLARREGVQVVLAVVGGMRPCPELIEDADLVRVLKVMP